MAVREYQALTRTDSEVIEAFKKIDADLGLEEQSLITIHLADQLNTNLSTTLKAMGDDKSITTLLASDAALALWLHQGVNPMKGYVRVTREIGTDKVIINVPNDLDVPSVTRLLAATKKHLPGYEAASSIEKTLGPEMREFYGRRDASLARLEGLSQKLIEDNEQYRRQLDAQLAADRQRVQQERDEAVAKAKADYELREGEVNKKEEQLEARAKELDDRTSRHVRREIRKEFLQKLASREKQFTLSSSTNSKRIAIHVQFWILLLIALGLAYAGFRTVLADPKDLFAYIRLAIGIVGFAGTSVYYIRWTDKWFRQHADEEFRLQRLALDFDRASWVVEMVLEWQQEKGEEIPTELIDRLTTNLFATGTASEALKHPAEDLAAALVGASANLKLNLPGGTELNIDRKGIKSLQS